MPKYEFRCNACKEAFELDMSIKEKMASQITCPNCRSQDVAQQYAGVNVHTGKTEKSDSCGCCGNQCRCRH